MISNLTKPNGTDSGYPFSPPNGVKYLKIVGDSMSPLMNENEIITVSEVSHYAAEGKLIVAKDSKKLMVGRLVKNNGINYLCFGNQSYPPLILSKRFSIVGVVCIAQRSFL